MDGLIPWHFYDEPNGGKNEPPAEPVDLGLVSLPATKKAWMEIGRAIVKHSAQGEEEEETEAEPSPPPPAHLRFMSMFGLGNATREAPLEKGWVTHWQGLAGDCNEAPGVKPKHHPDRCPVDSGNIQEMASVWQQHQIPGMYTELPGCGGSGLGQEHCGKAVWHRNIGNEGKGHTGLDKNWLQNLRAITTALRPAIEAGSITAVFLGDELVCHGVPYSNLSAVAKELRAGLGPQALLVVNDCAHSYTWEGGAYGWPAIPAEIDLVSADVYNATNGTAEAAEIIAFYERFIIPMLGESKSIVKQSV